MRIIDGDLLGNEIDKLSGKMPVDKKWRCDPNRDTKADGYWEGIVDALAKCDEAERINPIDYLEWVPCAYKMPEACETVLVTTEHTEWGDVNAGYLLDDGSGCWNILADGCVEEIDGKYVIAWMPLPLPYNAESEEI